VLGPKRYITIGEYSLIGIGAFLLIIALVLGARYQRSKRMKTSNYEYLDNPPPAPPGDSDGDIQVNFPI